MKRPYIASDNFERTVDRFLDQVLVGQWSTPHDQDALSALVRALREERADPETTQWRRIEARLGFDPDAAAAELVEAVGLLAEGYGLEAVEEAISAMPGTDAVTVLQRELDAAREQGHGCDFSALLSELPAVERPRSDPPWVAAEQSAAQVRSIGGISRGAINNAKLADLLGVARNALRQTTSGQGLNYGLRLAESGADSVQRVALRSKWPEARRFEFCRVLGDALWARDDRLGPIADTSTSRQKFQRAFAQSLLCPVEDLLAYLKTEQPNDEDIDAAAKHFQVAPRMVESVLVNKGVVAREQLAHRL